MRKLIAIVVFALALPLAAQELPSAPSASRQQAQEQAAQAQGGEKFQVSMKDAMSPAESGTGAAGFAGPWSGLQPRDAAVADHRSSGLVGRLLAPLVGRRDAGSDGTKPRAFGARIVGALSDLADLDNDPSPPQSNYSQYLGMSVSETIASAYLPLTGRGMRHSGGGFGAHVGASTGLNLMGEFLPGMKRFFVGHKTAKGQREALTWRTGTAAQQPDSVH